MGKIFQSLKRIYHGIIYAAWIINIFLLVFGAVIDDYELQILSIINMILLSFVLLKDTK